VFGGVAFGGWWIELRVQCVFGFPATFHEKQQKNRTKEDNIRHLQFGVVGRSFW